MKTSETSVKKRRRNKETEASVGDPEKDGIPIAALKLPEIIRKILSNLPTPDLLRCSLVCKAWNYESRCLLRDMRTIVARIKGPDPCLKLMEFNTLISSMTIIPFNGLRVSVTEETSSGDIHCFGPLDLNETYPYILKMNIKYLHIDWRGKHDADEGCTAVLLLQKFFQVSQLEHCELKRLPFWFDLYSRKVVDKLDLPNLRVLKLFEDAEQVPSRKDFRLVKAAPNLKQLHVEIGRYDRDLLPADKLKCVTNLVFYAEEVPDLEFFEQVILAGPKLQNLRVYVSPEMNSLDRTWRILKLLLEKNKDSLSCLRTDLVVALKLKNLRVSLPRLEKFEVGRLNFELRDVELIPLLGNIDFGQLFPGLRVFTFQARPLRSYAGELLQPYFTGHELAEREHLGRNYKGGLIFPTHFYPLSPHLNEQLLRTLVATFPNIKSFDTEAKFCTPPYTLLWELWPRLERLGVVLESYRTRNYPQGLTQFGNRDAEFCAISPEEATELQGKDDEFLEKVHIVPTRPAITCLQNLKHLKLRINEYILANLPENLKGLLLFSRVSGYVVFRRMPWLEVRIEFLTELQNMPLNLSIWSPL